LPALETHNYVSRKFCDLNKLLKYLNLFIMRQQVGILIGDSPTTGSDDPAL
jgi:hypothetical protein